MTTWRFIASCHDEDMLNEFLELFHFFSMRGVTRLVKVGATTHLYEQEVPWEVLI